MKTVNGMDAGPETLGTRLFYVPSITFQQKLYI